MTHPIPLPDGETFHLIRLDTGTRIFGRKDNAKLRLDGLNLTP